MTQVYDVNEARRNRAVGGWCFRLDGTGFVLPRELSREQAREIRKLDDNDVDGLIRVLLGELQYELFDAIQGVTMQDIAGILEAYGKATGLKVEGS